MSCSLSGNTLSSGSTISLCGDNIQASGNTIIRINSVNGGQRPGGSQYAEISTSTDGDDGSILNISAVKKLILKTTSIDGTFLQYSTNIYGKKSNDNGLNIQYRLI